MIDTIEGQMVTLTIRESDNENATWKYGVVKHKYDDRLHIILESGQNYMWVEGDSENENDIIDNQPSKSHVTPLYKNGERVMAKKKLFGGYIVKSK